MTTGGTTVQRAKTTGLYCWLLLAVTAAAADGLDWIPTPAESTRIYERVSERDDYTLITGPVQIRDYIEHGEELYGKITRSVYKGRLGKPLATVFEDYRQSLEQAGFQILFACATEKCGGIRFFQSLQPVRRMRTDPWDFHYLAARQGSAEQRTYLGFLLSSIRDDLYAARLVIERPSAQQIAGEQAAQAAAADTGVRISEQTEPESESADPESEEAAMTDTEGAEDPAEWAEEALDAEAMAERIAANGSVALYSIFFDVNSAAIRSESAPTLEQVARLLAENPELNLIVVGHTDNVGRLHYNLQLSERRAAAMVKQLIKRYKVPKQRLRSAGVGFLAPVASNNSEEGRAKNRRVELVAD